MSSPAAFASAGARARRALRYVSGRVAAFFTVESLPPSWEQQPSEPVVPIKAPAWLRTRRAKIALLVAAQLLLYFLWYSP